MHLRPLGHLSSARRCVTAARRMPAGAGLALVAQPQPPVSGGESGIRTHGTLSGTPDFESGTFGHSVISPRRNMNGGQGSVNDRKNSWILCTALRFVRLPRDSRRVRRRVALGTLFGSSLTALVALGQAAAPSASAPAAPPSAAPAPAAPAASATPPPAASTAPPATSAAPPAATESTPAASATPP